MKTKSRTSCNTFWSKETCQLVLVAHWNKIFIYMLLSVLMDHLFKASYTSISLSV